MTPDPRYGGGPAGHHAAQRLAAAGDNDGWAACSRLFPTLNAAPSIMDLSGS